MNASQKNADLEARKQRAAAGLQDLPAFRPHAAGIDLASTEHWVCCPANKPGANYVELAVMLSWAGKPLLHNTFGGFYST